MAGNIKGITVELNGNTTNLTKSINDANKACNSIAKELKTVDNLLKLDPGNVTLVKQKADLLNDSIAKTRTKLDELEVSQAQVTAQFKAGEIDAGQYRKFQQDIVKARTDLAALEEQQKSVTGIGGAFTVLKGKVGEVTEKLEPLTNGIKKAGQISGEVFNIGAKALLAYGTAAVTCGVAVAKMTANSAQAADDINTLSKQTGLSTNQIQRFQYATDVIDVSLDTLTGSMAKLTKNMSNAKDGTGTAAEAFKTLGVSIKDDATGELRNNQDVFDDAITALSNMSNETERDAAAMAIFGKSAQDLNPLIEGGADALKTLGDSAEAAGLILSQDALDALNEYQDSLDILKANSSAAGNILAGTFAGGLASATSAIAAAIPKLANFTAQLFAGGDISAAQANLTQFIGDMATSAAEQIGASLPTLLAGFNGVILSLVGGLAQSLPTVIATILPALMQGLTGLISGLVSLVPTVLPALIEGAAVLFTGIITGLTQIIPQIIEILPALVTQICGVLVENLPLLLDAAVQIIVAVTAAVIANFPQILTAVTSGLGNVLNSVITWFGGLMSQLGTWLAGIGEIVVAFFSTAFSTMVENLSTIWTNVTTWFNNLIAGVGSWLASVISTIITFAADMVSNAVQAASGFVGSIIKGISNLPANVGNTLINVISRVADFVSDMASKAADAAKGFIKNIVNGLADLPQKMTDIGDNIVKGIWKGIQDGWQWLTDSVANLADGLLNAAKKALGIHSPSTKFRDAVGKNMALGIGVGFAETMSKVRNDMAKAIPTNFTSGITLNAQTTAKRAADTLAAAGISLTVINNSPKAISAAESARLTRNALRTFVLQTGGAV